MSAYVCLLWHKSEARFKIGTMDLLASSSIELDQSLFDMTRTKAVCLADFALALNASQLLERAFQRYRITPSEEAKRAYPELSLGDAQWFKAECEGRLLTFVEDNEDLLDCRFVSPAEIASLFVTAGSALAKEFEPRSFAKQELDCQNSIQETVQRAGETLRGIARACRFVAVVRSSEGYQLIGEATVQHAAYLEQGFEQLFPVLKHGQVSEHTGTAHYFVVPMSGEPGLSPEDAVDYETWRERLVWSEKPELPGFDMPLRSSEARHATAILQKVFGRATPSPRQVAPAVAA